MFDDKSFGNALKVFMVNKTFFSWGGNASHGVYYICFSIMCLCRREDWAGAMMREGQLSVTCALCSQLCRAWDSSHQFFLREKKVTVDPINPKRLKLGAPRQPSSSSCPAAIRVPHRTLTLSVHFGSSWPSLCFPLRGVQLISNLCCLQPICVLSRFPQERRDDSVKP